MTRCEVYNGSPDDVCLLADQARWDYNYPLRTIIGTYDLLCTDFWYVDMSDYRLLDMPDIRLYE